MSDHAERVARAAASLHASEPSWRHRLSIFVIVAGALILAGALTVALSLVGGIRLLARTLDASPAPRSSLTAFVFMVFVVSPLAMWVFYRQFASSHEALTHLAGIDTLTGLPNRLGLTERLDRAIEATRERHDGVAVLFVDLDRFKVVNDTFGHELGDALMVQVATRLREAVRPGDEVSRYGGDEFVVICSEIANAGMAKQIAQRIIDAISVSYATGSQTLNISCSIGISLTNAQGVSAGDALRDADVAMYQAKGAGPGVYRIYDHILGKALTPSAIEARLRSAVDRSEFRVYYQPVVDTLTGTILGLEALLRWEDPERGLVEPGDFLPLLEETGLIVEVGEWVLHEACRQAAIWRDQFPEVPLEIKVNVSARQLGQVDFGKVVSSALEQHSLHPESLILEITESALMDDISSAWSMLRATKASGVRLALDDFGTGFSSLSYIRQFSLDMLKIDRSFVTGIAREHDDLAIVAHVIGLASALGMITVAEGVEESQQLLQLQRLGCDRAQGFWFSPPVPPSAIAAMLADTTLPERWSHVAEPGEMNLGPVRPTGLPNPLGPRVGYVSTDSGIHVERVVYPPLLPRLQEPLTQPRPVTAPTPQPTVTAPQVEPQVTASTLTPQPLVMVPDPDPRARAATGGRHPPCPVGTAGFGAAGRRVPVCWERIGDPDPLGGQSRSSQPQHPAITQGSDLPGACHLPTAALVPHGHGDRRGPTGTTAACTPSCRRGAGRNATQRRRDHHPGIAAPLHRVSAAGNGPTRPLTHRP